MTDASPSVRALVLGAALALPLASISCSSDDPSTPGSSGTSGAPSGSDSGTSVDASPGSPPGGAVPTNAAGMNAFLQSKGYAAWAKESAPHPSTGPHGGMVLTYVDPTLEGSLAAGNAEHPVGSASVKELIAGGKVTGWAAYVKTQASSDQGKGWYWYEVFDAAPGARGTEGQGNATCTGCHSRGKDYVRVPYPLQ
jgi:hypothetical protein